jgi:glucan phosphoethanolaminetransferase (alkaline phosphatase superfamily)
VQSLIRYCQSLGFERFFIRADSVAKAVCEKMTNAQLSKSPLAAKGSLGRRESDH